MKQNGSQQKTDDVSRRGFLKGTAAAAGATALTAGLSSGVHASSADEIRFVLVGCGGRGTGASAQIMNSKHKTKLVAIADAFEDKTEGTFKRLSAKYGDKVDLPKERRFFCFDAYKKSM